MHSGENRRCREADAMEEVTRRMDVKCCGNVYEKPSNGIQWPPRPQFHGAVSVICAQPQSENIKGKVPAINNL